MKQFLERHNLPRLTQEETDNLNGLLSITETESIMNNLPKQKAPDPDKFTGKIYQTYKEESIPIITSMSLSEDRSRGNSS